MPDPTYSPTRYMLRERTGRHPLLFRYTYGLKASNRSLLVGAGTELVIEGFPRSGNSYAVTAFRTLQNRPVSLAHHLHVPAQVITAVRREIPVVVLVRDPRQAVASLLLMYPRLGISRALQSYINFYSDILPFRKGFVVCMFEELINDFPLLIRRINTRYGLTFNEAEIGSGEQRSIEDHLRYVGAVQGGGRVEQTGLPSKEKELLKHGLLEELATGEHKALLLHASRLVEVYRQIREKGELEEP